MIDTLQITGFKSIRDLTLHPRRINVFVGPPSSGKSNILEVLGLFSFLYYSQSGYNLGDFVRFESVSNLFYDDDPSSPIAIKCGALTLDLTYGDGTYRGSASRGGQMATLSGGHQFLNVQLVGDSSPLAVFKSYRYRAATTFGGSESDYLRPPYGQNLLSLLLKNRELRNVAAQPFSALGLRLIFRKQENKLEVQKSVDDVVIAYPYSLVSETLQRVVFYLAAIVSNRDSVLIFEEPEAHAFPFYTKYLAETIALDENNNQYFISTHNPYFLLPLLEKCPVEEIAVNATHFKDYETRVRPLTAEELSEVDRMDLFSNLDRYASAR